VVQAKTSRRLTAAHVLRPQRRRAQAIVEIALVAPVLVLALSIVVDFGRMFYYDIAVKGAVREGARYAIDTSRTDAEIAAAVRRAAPGITVTNVTTTPSPRTSGDAGDPVTVEAEFLYNTITPFVSLVMGDPRSIVHRATMQMLG
jgi:Flp pilus assembly protein TadG